MITITAHFKGNGLSNLLKALDRIEAAAASQAENLPEAGSVAMKNAQRMVAPLKR